MMYTIAEGDEYEHEDYGTVQVQELEETLTEGYITDTGDKLVFDGAEIGETRVLFHIKDDGRVGSQEVMAFCKNVNLAE